ncbi:MAG TPA: glycosyltransferase family 2 protein [Terriglobales bacterium]|nr:glycosyltransferase family 2 protein [Terriglobales bacterium]
MPPVVSSNAKPILASPHTESQPPVPEVCIVVPVHNEAANIKPLLEEIHAALRNFVDYEIVYVDDGSTDATPRVLEQCAASDARLRPLRHLRNSGQSAALATGVRAARAPWIVTLDGDGQNDPADIPALLQRVRQAPAEEKPAIICGQRMKRRDSWIKRVSSRVANGVRARILHDHTPDTGCGLKLFRRDVFLKLPQFDHMHRFLPALFQMTGARALSVPVNHRPRTRGRSHYGMHDRLWVGITDLIGVMWLRRRIKITDCVSLRESGDAHT